MKKSTLLLLLLFALCSIQAQDYKISFAGTGASTTVDTVKVENLTQKKSLTMNGSDVLHLVATSTLINAISDVDNAIQIYPNPTNSSSTIDFGATASGKTNIEIFDFTGKRLCAKQNTLTIGTHAYQVSNLSSGIYMIRISSRAFTYTGKLVSNCVPNSEVKLNYIGHSVIPGTAKMLKSVNVEKLMQYNDGDVLKYTGTTGNYSTIVPDVPNQSKTLTFTFIACTDFDGNNYPVGQIGTQIWMVENLKTTRYNDGTDILSITDNTTWENLITPGYCFYNNGVVNKNTYGALYNWYAVNTGKLAPKGWHVPTNDEYTTLITFLGGESVASSKLKESGTSHWQSPNTEATNQSGFTALPGG